MFDLYSIKRQEKVSNFLSIIGALGFMIGLYYHTYGFFSSFFASPFIGHCIAAAMDATAYGAMFRRRQILIAGELGVTAWFILIVAAFTSLFTNLEQGFVTNFNRELTWYALNSV
jgi:hypothetical protein